MNKLMVSLLGSAMLVLPALADEAPKSVAGLDRVKHIVVIYLENRSFDQLYGTFPGAEGLANVSAAATQVDKDGKPYEKLPPVMNTNMSPPQIDSRFPSDLPNKPFSADKIAGLSQTTGDAVHRYYQEQYQIDAGKMDKFVAWSDAGSLVMSNYDMSKAPLWDYARKYVLFDHFHHAAFGGSFLNHFYLACACTPRYENAPAALLAQLDDKGMMVKDGPVTPDFYAVNTMFPVNGPYPASLTDKTKLLPVQTLPNIGDRLSAKSVSWAWYSGGWNDALAGKPDELFQFHHQVFAFFANTANGTDGAKAHLKDEADFIADIHNGTLSAVSFFKPLGEDNEHPGYANVDAGEAHTKLLLQLLEKSPQWQDTAVIITYDENGGMWDHVAPPVVDKWGPGSRVPTLLISPLAKKGFVDHSVLDTTAILKLIETRFGLAPLTSRDAASGDMTEAFDLK